MADYEFTILGCGASGGVPRVGMDWGRCDPLNPKNRRRRCALLIERIGPGGRTTVLIDTGPDIHHQLVDAGVRHLDAVLYTHAHADHIHGIDDLRGLAYALKRRVDVHMDAPTSARAHAAFGYCFTTPEGSFYPPILNEHRLTPGEPVVIQGAGGPVSVWPARVNHGEIDALAFRVAGVAYSPDVVDIPEESLPLFEGLDLWIIDALRPGHKHPSHFSLEDALFWIGRMTPERSILTNLHIDMDYDWLTRTLPDDVIPAYDRMRFLHSVGDDPV